MVNRRNTLINYDRLADAIVAAQKRAEEKETESNEKKKKINIKEFFIIIGSIITNKSKTDGTMISGLFSLVVAGFFNVLAIIGTVAFVSGIVIAYRMIKELSWSVNNAPVNLFNISFMVIVLLLIFAFSLVLRASANEISSEKDRNYVVNVFAGLTSFVALIVAVIALYKGIN